MKIQKPYHSEILLHLLITFPLIFLLPYLSFAQNNIVELSRLINGHSFKLPDGLGDSLSIEYTFVNAGCFCSITQANTGKKERLNSISTFSFNLGELKNGKILISKPKDSNFEETILDIWRIEIGVFDVLVQNTNWQSQQTKTNHFYFNVEGEQNRDRILDVFSKSIQDCKGSVAEITILN